MANPNPELIKLYLKNLLKSLDAKKAAGKPDSYSATINKMFDNTKDGK
jgi:hypothetical protein